MLSLSLSLSLSVSSRSLACLHSLIARARCAACGQVTLEGECSYQLNSDSKLLEPLEDINWKDTSDPTVRGKMQYLYAMGIRMLGSANEDTAEKLKQMVIEKLVNRVGLEPKEFDDWLL